MAEPRTERSDAPRVAPRKPARRMANSRASNSRGRGALSRADVEAAIAPLVAATLAVDAFVLETPLTVQAAEFVSELVNVRRALWSAIAVGRELR